MRTQDDIARLIVESFSDRLSPTELQRLVLDVYAAIADRHARGYAPVPNKTASGAPGARAQTPSPPC